MLKRASIAVAVAVGFFLWYFASFGFRTTRLSTIQKLLAKNTKVGESATQVSSFLDAQGIEHSAVTRPEAMYVGHDHNYSNLPVIVAIKRHTMRAPFTEESIQMIFVFNDQNELQKFDVVPVYTSF